ncbi:hypothetical protein AB0B71_07755 [Micromonospora echinofusca]|uniref:hypothetical protein n=1 Tax=Micromonospora echinofusca TaxID=47858 RepID=UPI0033C44026
MGSFLPFALPTGAGTWRTRPARLRLLGSGRQALRELVSFGQRELGWASLHLPSYYCPGVAAALDDLLPVHTYPAGPEDGVVPQVDAPSGAVVAVSYFGAPPVSPTGSRAALIVDTTHDPVAPWLSGTSADYAFASLRKTLPLPDGGALWAAPSCPLPPQRTPGEGHLATVATMLSAMCLKAAYLDGAPVPKERYLALAASAEQALESRVVSGMSDYSAAALDALPVDQLRQHRTANAIALQRLIAGVPDVIARAYPFGVVLVFDTVERRERVRRGLIAEQVYPAVLWAGAVDGTTPVGSGFADRMLFLHTDFRYAEPDLARVAVIVRRLCLANVAPDQRGTPC